MKHVFLTLITLSALMAQTADIFRTTNGYSAKAAALGGTEIATNASAYSIHSNPALLSELNQFISAISGVFNNISEDRKYPAYSAFDSRNGNEVYAISNLYTNQLQFAAAYGMRMGENQLTLALSNAKIYDHNYYYREIVRRNQFNDRVIIGAQTLESVGEVYAFALGGGIDLGSFQAGISAGLIHGPDYRWEKAVRLSPNATPNDYDIDEIQAVTGSLRMSLDNSPVVIRFGATYSVIDQLRLGVSFATPYTLDMKRSDDVVFNYDVPAQIGFGIQYYGANELAAKFTFDVIYEAWSELEIASPNADDALTGLFDDVYIFRFGLEHQVTEEVPLRLGARFENSKQDEDASITTFSLGTGLEFQSLMIDFSFEYAYLTYTEADLFPEAIWINTGSGGVNYSNRTGLDTIDQTTMTFKVDVMYMLDL